MGKSSSTKGQSWYLDFVMGLTMMTIAFVIFLNATSGIIGPDEFGSAVSDAGRISGMLLGSGYPGDWDNSSVELIGISENNRINATKLQMASAISYEDTRALFGTRHDYYVFFRDSDGNVLNLGGFCGIGKNQTSALSQNFCSNFSVEADHLAKEERLVIYDSRITSMVTYVWE